MPFPKRTELSMRALTLWQPWASLIVAGVKPVENRTWPVPPTVVGVRVAIHAGKTWDEDGAEWIDLNRRQLDLPRDFLLERAAYDFGAIVGSALVVRTVKQHPSPWFFGPFGHLVQEPLAFAESIPCKGERGYWFMPPELEAAVKGAEEATRRKARR